MSKTFKGFVVVLISLLFATTAMAQSTTSAIAGHVTDANGPVQDAMVTAVYTPTGLAYHAFTNRDGAFRLNSVVAGGPYTIKIEMMGHQTLVIKDIKAPLASTVIIEPVLKIEANTIEEVVVTAEGISSNMNIENAGAGTNIGVNTIEKMPTTNRSMNDIMKLTPQAAVVGGGFAAGGGNYRGSSVTVDGAAFNNAFGIGSNLPAGGSPISLDAIDQLTINLTPFDVRQSGFQGSSINVVTKQGGNEWHGSVYNYYTNAERGVLVGDDFISPTNSINNTMGFTLGGPIIKDKLFFFVNGEYTIDNVAGSTRQARESATDEWGKSSTYNRPTVADMDMMRQFLIDNYDYDPGRYQGYSLSTPDYKLLARLDWNINPNNRFNLRFSHTHTYGSNQPSSSMSPIGGTNTTVNIGGVNYTFNRNNAGRQSYYSLYYESARYYQEQNFTSLAAELNSRLFGGKAANTLRATWSYQNEPRSFEGDLFPTVDILEPYTDATDGSTQYAFYTTFGIDPFTYANLRRVNTINVTDEISYVTGRHNITGGAQFEFNRIVNGFMQGGAGWYIFDSWNSFATGANPLSFMITHANLDDPTQTVYPTYDYMQASLYAQDEIEFSKYFKMTAGIRLEMPIISFPNDNLNKDFAAVAAANPTSSFAGLSTADLPATTLNISPRLGFNWDVTKDRKVVVRGGTGLFTGRIPNVWLVSAAGNSNVLQYQYIANLKTGSPVVPFSADRTDIINSIYSGTAFTQQDLPAPTSTTILAKDLRMPTSWKTSAAVDVKLPLGIKGTLEGLYSYNFNEVVATTLGYTTNTTVQLPGEPEERDVYTSEGITNSNGAKMSGYYLHNAKDLHGQYWSVTAQLEKNFAFGLDLMAAYTHSFSYSATDGAGDQVYNIAQISNVNGDNSHELGYSYYVSPNRLIANASYTIYEGPRTATKLGLFYEGSNICYVGSYNQARYSYVMTNDDQKTGISTSQLVYIPTADELATMPFSSTDNRDAYEAFIASDPYLSAHRGEYSKRNGAVAPWLNRINFRISREIYFDVNGRKTTLDLGADINNLLNLFSRKLGIYQQLSSESILSYKAGVYTFTEPTWNNYNNFLSTWSLLLHVRYSF